jgi:hypothetical protein
MFDIIIITSIAYADEIKRDLGTSGMSDGRRVYVACSPDQLI